MRQALELALEALTYIYTETTADEDELIDQAITAIKEALAQPEQEPVAWWIPKAEQFCLPSSDGTRPFAKAWEPLYTTLPQRTWVGLPESAFAGMTLQQVTAMKYAEQILKDQNT